MHYQVRSCFTTLIAASLVAILMGCGTPTRPCGDFNFAGTATTRRGVDVSVAFDFKPALCATVCESNTNAYVQMVRIIDLDTGAFVAPNSEQQNRIVTGRPQPAMNGWAIDRVPLRRWGHYGRNDDGSFASIVTTGSNTTPATLWDSPSVVPDHVWFDAVSVPVSIDPGSACTNRLLGYQYWLFVLNGGVSTAPFNATGVDWHRDAFDHAVTEWNADASGLGKNSFPVMTRLEP